jgi:hypothetical protein
VQCLLRNTTVPARALLLSAPCFRGVDRLLLARSGFTSARAGSGFRWAARTGAEAASGAALLCRAGVSLTRAHRKPTYDSAFWGYPSCDSVVMRAPFLAALIIVAAGLVRPALAGVCIGTLEECVAKAREQAEPSTNVDVMISFDNNSAVLSPEAQAKLDAFAKAMMDERLGATSFVIEGHTDAFGPDSYNADLSLRRARSVAAFLVEKGVPTTRLEAVGLGESAPRATDPYDAANRRVEMRIKLR